MLGFYTRSDSEYESEYDENEEQLSETEEKSDLITNTPVKKSIFEQVGFLYLEIITKYLNNKSLVALQTANKAIRNKLLVFWSLKIKAELPEMYAYISNKDYSETQYYKIYQIITLRNSRKMTIDESWDNLKTFKSSVNIPRLQLNKKNLLDYAIDMVDFDKSIPNDVASTMFKETLFISHIYHSYYSYRRGEDEVVFWTHSLLSGCKTIYRFPLYEGKLEKYYAVGENSYFLEVLNSTITTLYIINYKDTKNSIKPFQVHFYQMDLEKFQKLEIDKTLVAKTVGGATYYVNSDTKEIYTLAKLDETTNSVVVRNDELELQIKLNHPSSHYGFIINMKRTEIVACCLKSVVCLPSRCIDGLGVVYSANIEKRWETANSVTNEYVHNLKAKITRGKSAHKIFELVQRTEHPLELVCRIVSCNNRVLVTFMGTLYKSRSVFYADFYLHETVNPTGNLRKVGEAYEGVAAGKAKGQGKAKAPKFKEAFVL
jgi:hypothetical protein